MDSEARCNAIGVPKQMITGSIVNMSMYIEPRYQWAWFHKEIAEALQDPTVTRLIISLPPQHYKSTLINRYILWLLGNDPDGTKVALCSYGADLAAGHSYDAQKLFATVAYKQLFDLEIDPRQATKELWGIKEHEGRVKSVGVDGSLFGFPASHIVLDDMIKPTDAFSDAEKEKAERFYKAEVMTRLQDEHSKIICIGSRVAEDDFIGKRIKEGGWKVIVIPAISAQGNRYEAQPMDKLPEGKPLLKSMKFYLMEKTGMTDAEFECQFQGNPLPRGELLLGADELTVIDEEPTEVAGRKVRGWDIAFTGKKNSDKSATALLSRDIKGGFYAHHVFGWRATYDVNKRKIKEIILADDPTVIQVIETNSGGECLYSDLKNDAEIKAHGCLLIGSFSKVDKVSRAEGWMLKAKLGTFKIVKGAWNAAFFVQLNHFKKHSTADDLIDAVSKAWEILIKFKICPK